MKIKYLKTLHRGWPKAVAGQTDDLAPNVARALIANGTAAEVKPPPVAPPKPAAISKVESKP